MVTRKYFLDKKSGRYYDASEYSLASIRRFYMQQDIHPTKLAIMQAAVDVFVQKGFSGTSTKEIAQMANIGESTIFRHFPNKSEILYGVVDHLIPLLGVKTLDSCIEESRGLDAEAALLNLIRNRLEIIGPTKNLLRIILTESQYDEKLRDIYSQKVYGPIRGLLIGFFTERIGKGEFRSVSPELPANILFAFFLQIIGNDYLLGPNFGANDYSAEDLTDILMNGIKKRSKSDE